MLFFHEKMQILNFVSIATGSKILQTGLVLVSQETHGRIWYQLCRNFPASWSRLGAAVKNVLGETRFSRDWVFFS
jgi:hypothetical protein